MTSATQGVPTGNTYDKYGATNPLVRRLMANFEATLDGMFDRTAPASVLDVGCGEGVVTARWARRRPQARIVGLDLDDPKLRAEWERRRLPNLEFRATTGETLPYGEGEFALASAIEVLEHVSDPDGTLSEMARVARGGHLVASVPREPLWRMLNVARGSYLGQLGNTPGHINHFSRRGFARLLGRHGEVIELRAPFPWTMALVRVG